MNELPSNQTKNETVFTEADLREAFTVGRALGPIIPHNDSLDFPEWLKSYMRKRPSNWSREETIKRILRT